MISAAPERMTESLPPSAQPASVKPTDVHGETTAAREATELFDRAQEAVSALRGRGRRPDGKFGAGNTLNLRHGLRSEQLIKQPDVSVWHREQVSVIVADLGGETALSALELATVREAARLEVILGALGTDLLERGPLTGKGKSRAATTTYLRVLDRFVRIAGTLGLERRARQTNALDIVHDGDKVIDVEEP